MLIKSLRLENYRKFKDERVDFPDGVIGVVGNNGAGKSTLIEAIAWTIYGSDAARSSPNEIKRDTAQPDDICRVELEFILADDSYRVIRELRGSRMTPGAKLFANGSPDPQVIGADAVSEFLTSRIGLDYSSFITSLFARQKELSALSQLQPRAREKRILRLLKVDRIDRAVDLVRSDKKESDRTIQTLQSTMKDLPQLNKNLETTNNDLIKLRQSFSRLGTQYRDALQAASKKKVHRDQQQRLSKQYEKLSKSASIFGTQENLKDEEKRGKQLELDGLAKKRDELAMLQPTISSYLESEREKSALDKLREKFLEKKRLQEEIQANEVRLIDFEGAITNLNSTITELGDIPKQIKEIERNIRSIEKRRRLASNLKGAAEDRIKTTKKQILDLRYEYNKVVKLGAKSRCPTCKRVLGELHVEITEHLKGEEEKLNGQLQLLRSKAQQLTKDLESLQDNLTSEGKKKVKLQKKFGERSQHIGRLKNMRRELHKLNIQLKTQRSRLKRFATLEYDESRHNGVKREYARLKPTWEKAIGLRREIRRISSLEHRIVSLGRTIVNIKQKRSELGKKITNLKFDESVYNSAIKDYDVTVKDREAKQKEFLETKRLLALAVQERNNLRKDIRAEKQKKRDVDKETRKITVLKILEQVLIDFRTDLASRIRPMLEARASQMFNQLTNGKYPQLSIDDKYNLWVQDGNKQYALPRFSGGEEDLANLCLRIAISQVLAEQGGGRTMNFIALDEIFGSQDAGRKTNILRALTSLTNQFRQIVLITHVEDVKDALPYALSVVENADKTSSVKGEGVPRISYT